MRPVGSGEELKRRRLRALAILKAEENISLNEVARRCGCNASSVMRWRDAFLAGGTEALEPKPVPGRPNRLSQEQRALLIQYLLQGSLAHGYQTDLWTTQRIADMIKKKFKIQYHPDHIGRLLHAQGWSCQKPERRALQRKEARIQGWRRRTWPTVKKTPNGWAPISPSPTNPASS